MELPLILIYVSRPSYDRDRCSLSARSCRSGMSAHPSLSAIRRTSASNCWTGAIC